MPKGEGSADAEDQFAGICTSAKDKVTGFFLNRKDECLQKEGSRRITVSAPDALFKRIEAAAKERGLSKNAFILSLVHKELDE